MQKTLRFAPKVALFGFIAVYGIGCASTSATNCSERAVPPASLEAMVVGTIHKFHLVQPEYPLTVLGTVLQQYQPDLVLVEIRPNALAEGHYEDGPFEMAYVVNLAKSRGIPVEGIDWFRETDVGAEPPNVSEADMAQFKKETDAIEAKMPWPPTLRQAHSQDSTRAMLAYLNAHARFQDGNASWNRRQAWFHRHSSQAIGKHKARKVLAFVGNQHRPELEQHLAAMGATLRSPLDVVPKGLEQGSVSDDIVALWEAGIKRMEEKAAAAPEALKKALEVKAEYFRVAVKLRGACCAEDE